MDNIDELVAAVISQTATAAAPTSADGEDTPAAKRPRLAAADALNTLLLQLQTSDSPGALAVVLALSRQLAPPLPLPRQLPAAAGSLQELQAACRQWLASAGPSVKLLSASLLAATAQLPQRQPLGATAGVQSAQTSALAALFTSWVDQRAPAASLAMAALPLQSWRLLLLAMADRQLSLTQGQWLAALFVAHVSGAADRRELVLKQLRMRLSQGAADGLLLGLAAYGQLVPHLQASLGPGLATIFAATACDADSWLTLSTAASPARDLQPGLVSALLQAAHNLALAEDEVQSLAKTLASNPDHSVAVLTELALLARPDFQPRLPTQLHAAFWDYFLQPTVSNMSEAATTASPSFRLIANDLSVVHAARVLSQGLIEGAARAGGQVDLTNQSLQFMSLCLLLAAQPAQASTVADRVARTFASAYDPQVQQTLFPGAATDGDTLLASVLSQIHHQLAALDAARHCSTLLAAALQYCPMPVLHAFFLRPDPPSLHGLPLYTITPVLAARAVEALNSPEPHLPAVAAVLERCQAIPAPGMHTETLIFECLSNLQTAKTGLCLFLLAESCRCAIVQR